MSRVELKTPTDRLFATFFLKAYSKREIRNLPVQIKAAIRSTEPVNEIRHLLASVDENFTGDHLSAYRDVEALNEEIADFVHASRTLPPEANLYLSYYLSSGNASLCVIRENGNFRVELRILKPKEKYEFSDLKRHRIKKSDSRNNVTPFALGVFIFFIRL